MQRRHYAMLQNLKTQQGLVDRLLEIERTLEPLVIEKEELKAALRSFGPAAYNGDGGFVTVSAPAVAKKTGEKLVADEKAFKALEPQMQAFIMNAGFLSYQDVFSQNRAAQVSVKLTTVSV